MSSLFWINEFARTFTSSQLYKRATVIHISKLQFLINKVFWKAWITLKRFNSNSCFTLHIFKSNLIWHISKKWNNFQNLPFTLRIKIIFVPRTIMGLFGVGATGARHPRIWDLIQVHPRVHPRFLSIYISKEATMI